MKNFKVLVGCEESQAVCKAFRLLGIEAFSNDIVDCSGGCPEYHLKMDIFEAVDIVRPDVLIAFPPCTYLTVTANRSFVNNPGRWRARLDAMIFVHNILNLPVRHIALENPVGVISTHIRKPDQIIQPYWFGERDSKKTCLWLKDLPLLEPVDIVEPVYCYDRNGKRYSETHMKTGKGCGAVRSKTYPGVASAMASQWTSYILERYA